MPRIETSSKRSQPLVPARVVCGSKGSDVSGDVRPSADAMASALNDFDRSSLALLQGLLAEHVLAGDKLSYHAIANAFERR